MLLSLYIEIKGAEPSKPKNNAAVLLAQSDEARTESTTDLYSVARRRERELDTVVNILSKSDL